VPLTVERQSSPVADAVNMLCSISCNGVSTDLGWKNLIHLDYNNMVAKGWA